jgi:sporulation protein YlmC with PRC-barrel domain
LESPLSAQKYTEDQLRDTLVIDSTGYICGWISSFEVKPQQIVVNIYNYETQSEEVLDQAVLLKRLVKYVPQQGLFRREPTLADVHTLVRDALKLPAGHTVGEEHLVKYAKKQGLTIPRKQVETRKRVEYRDIVDWQHVSRVGFTDLGKCALLTEPIEAKRRGISVKKGVPFKDTEYLEGRMVIDAEAKHFGSAVRLLIGLPPGILVNREHLVKREVPDLERLRASLVPAEFRNVKALDNQIKRDMELTTVTDQNLLEWAEGNDLTIPTTIEQHKEVERELPISWDKVSCIGDVVVLNDTVEEIERAHLESL